MVWRSPAVALSGAEERQPGAGDSRVGSVSNCVLFGATDEVVDLEIFLSQAFPGKTLRPSGFGGQRRATRYVGRGADGPRIC